MTDKFDPGLSDEALDRVLGELKAPAPSDLLRARLDNAMGTDGDAQRVASPSPSRWPMPRTAMLARLAAALLIAAFTGLAAWLPPPGLVPGPGILAASPAPVPSPWRAVLDQGAPGDGAAEAETGLTLTLVGSGGAAIAAVGLVRADWSAALARAENEPGFAAEGGAETLSDLEAIPLD